MNDVITHRLRPVSVVKRPIALLGGLVVVAIVAGLLLIGAYAIRATGQGADTEAAFSATEIVPSALAAQLSWRADALGLVRPVEPATRESVTATWLRSHDAMQRASEGDLRGLEVWFSESALDSVTARFAASDTVRAPSAIGHEAHVVFYSLDGQIMVIRVERTSARGELADRVEELEAILVLSDGNWRIRHIERI